MPQNSNFTNTEIQQLKTSVNDLGRELMQQTQDAHGFFTTKTRFAVSYSDPTATQRVQENLDHAVALLGIANIMAIFECHIPRKYWSAVFKDPSITLRLRAYNHIRLSAVHGFTGNRAEGSKKHFDKVMVSAQPLKGVKFFDASSIKLDELAASYAIAFLSETYSKAVVKVHEL